MAFKMSGFSAFTKNGITEDEKKRIAENQDPPTGENRREQALSIIKAMESDLKRLRAEGKTDKQLQQLILALSKNKKEYKQKYQGIFK